MDLYRMPIVGPIADIFLGLWMLLPFVLGIGWAVDNFRLRRERNTAQANFNLIDPIRIQVEGGITGQRLRDICDYMSYSMSKDDLKDASQIFFGLWVDAKEPK